MQKDLGVLTAKIPEDEGQNIVQASWLGQNLVEGLSYTLDVPQQAWTTCAVVDEEDLFPVPKKQPKAHCTCYLIRQIKWS
jgi:hypothetical protein